MKFAKGLIVGVLFTILAIYYYNKNSKKIALPDSLKLNKDNSNVIELKPESERENFKEVETKEKAYPPKTYISLNQGTEDLRQFEENLNEIAGNRYFSEVGYADDYFFRVLTDFKKGTSGIFFDNYISEDFVKDFNIFYNHLKNIKDFRKNLPKEEIIGIKKGDKATEVNMIKSIINRILKTDELKEDGNYNKKLYQVLKDLLTGTSIYDADKDGIVSNEFIRNTYNLINNLKF